MSDTVADPILSKLIELAGELLAMEAIAIQVRQAGFRSDTLDENIAQMEGLQHDLITVISERIVGLATASRYQRSSTYGKEN